MRTANAFVLGLWFLTAQSVAWADCCCGSFCRHKNACTGCGPEDACPGGAGKSSCCDEEESRSDQTCSHLEPSSEIDACSADSVPAQDAEQVVHLDLSLPPAPPAPPVLAVDTGPPRAGPHDALRPHLLI